MKTILFEVSQEEQEKFKKITEGLEVTFVTERLSEENLELAKGADIISGFIETEIKKEQIDLLPNLKFITTRSTGYDHVDTAYAKTKNIKVANVPAYGSQTVAEFAFALLLSLSRKIYTAVDRLKDEGEFSTEGLRGFDLNGKILGVVGTGKIGKNVIRIAKSFGMKVVACDSFPDQDFARDNEFEYKSFDELLAVADVISLHAPYSKENHHLMNKEKMSLCKRGVYIINTARGELIDTDALLWALKEGVIAGAGLDVLEGERELTVELDIVSSSERSAKVKDFKTLFENKVLIDMENVIITPHIAFYTEEAEGRIRQTTIDNIKAFIDGKPINLVN